MWRRGHGAGEQAFTLVELMIVVAIIGILVTIAIPQFAYLVSKSKEAHTRDSLGQLRSALAIYYSDNDNFYPTDNLASLVTNTKYLSTMPDAVMPQTSFGLGHGGPFTGVAVGVIPDDSDDFASGHAWLYDNTGPDSENWGSVIINCTHGDINGRMWTSF